MRFLGFNKEGYYQVGHSAIIIINPDTGKCHYFDFGRYHAPFGYGRVRDEVTDHELRMKTKARISSEGISNVEEVVEEIASNESSHGTGVCYASCIVVDFNKAFSRAKEMQAASPIAYGPFLFNGTNCSRFVRTIVVSGISSAGLKTRLAFPLSLSPTPLGIVKTLGNVVTYPLKKTIAVYPAFSQ